VAKGKLNPERVEQDPRADNTIMDGKVAAVGSSYPDGRFVNPWNAGLDKQFPTNDGYSPSDKTLYGPTATPEAMGALELNGMSDYDSNWEHGVRGGIEKAPKGPREGSRWTPKGGRR
jgi:hypothetical protein